MTLKKCLLTMVSLTLLLWSIFIFLIIVINPETANWIALSLIYFSLFLSLSSLITIISFIIRKKINKKELPFYLIKTSFRQSFSFAFLIIATLFMLAQNLFSWFNILIIIIILSIIEYIFINEKK